MTGLHGEPRLFAAALEQQSDSGSSASSSSLVGNGRPHPSEPLLGPLQPVSAPYSVAQRWRELGFSQSRAAQWVGRSLTGLTFSILGQGRRMKSRWNGSFSLFFLSPSSSIAWPGNQKPILSSHSSRCPPPPPAASSGVRTQGMGPGLLCL